MKTTIANYPKLIFCVFSIVLFTTVFNVSRAQNGVGINTTTPKSNFEVNGSVGQVVTTVTASAVLDATQSIIVCDNGASIISVTLPAVSICPGRIYTVKRNTTSTANVIIRGTIDGVANLTLKNAGEAVTIFSNGTEWKAMGSSNNQNPLGEISYFDMTGILISISSISDGTTNMVACRPTSIFLNGTDFDNGGTNNGRLRYVGKTSKTFLVICNTTSTPSASNDQFIYGIAKNGTVMTSSKVIHKLFTAGDAQTTALQVMVTLSANDYLELYLGNISSASGLLIKSFNLIAMGM